MASIKVSGNVLEKYKNNLDAGSHFVKLTKNFTTPSSICNVRYFTLRLDTCNFLIYIKAQNLSDIYLGINKAHDFYF